MSDSREEQAEEVILTLYKIHAYIPYDAQDNPLTPFGNFREGYKAATEQQQSVIAELEGKFDILHDKLLAIGAQMLIAIPDDDDDRRRAFSLLDDALKLAKVKGVK